MHALPALEIAVGNRLEGKAAGDIDERIDLAEMRRGGIDRLFGLRAVGEVDAAEFDPLGSCGDLRGRMIDAGHPRAARDRGFRDHLAERAQRAGDDDHFSIHLKHLRSLQEAHTIAIGK